MKKSNYQLFVLFIITIMFTVFSSGNLLSQTNGLFFSEYGEGTSNNKFLEIYNATGNNINLSDYNILTNYNGNPWSGMHSFPTGAVLAPGDVWVIANDAADPVILAQADEVHAWNASGYLMAFNGDDVRALVYITPTDTTILDIIGLYDLIDPGDGWPVAGVPDGTKEHTLVRKSSVCTGNPDWNASAGTDSLNSEWIVYPQDTWTYLGAHIGCTAGTTGLFFSEYGEGSSSNKYLEIYNISGADIILSDFSILTNYNGNPWSGMHNFPQGTILNNDSVWVIANDAADPAILAEADQIMAWDSSGYVVGFNGDDVRALVEIDGADTTILDIIGRYDLVDPGSGWEVAGVPDATNNHTLVRKSSVCTGNSVWDQSAGTNASNSEWIVYPIDTWTYLGSHSGCVTVDTIPPTVVQAFPQNATTIVIVFNEGVNTTAGNAANYTGLGTINNVYHPVDGDSVILTLVNPLPNGAQSTLTIDNVEDLAGNPMAAPESFTFVFNNSIESIVITEIMYNVPSWDTLEFVEVYNNGNTVANIGGYYFSEGVDFEFPANTMMNPGDYLVVAINASGVDNFFGITGTFEWESGAGLNNGGEDIEISNTAGDIIDYVDYDDQAPWPTSPDGGGPTLTFCDPSLDNSNPANWSASVEFAGVLPNGDTIWATPKEGCNITPPLAADFMANNTVITLGSVVDFTDMTSGGPTSWDWTFDGATPINSNVQNPTSIQYLSIGTFDVKLVVSNGNDTDSITKIDYITVVDSTKADIVITEIMYNPPESGTDSLEFIEIYNNGTSIVNLAGYEFTEGVEFVFPNVDINPGEYFVIAVDSLVCINFFGVMAYQWTSGGLSNGGEDIELTNDVGLVIDYVDYDDGAPWPTEPDGNGPSLTFCDPSLDNSDPLNWTASTEFAGVNATGDSIWATPGQGCADLFELNGSLFYDNAAVTALNNTTVYLKNISGTKLDSVITDASGYYSFSGLQDGVYVLDAHSDKVWGGANSIDALAIMQHFVSMITLTDLRAKVADVNGVYGINSVDALMVQQRFIAMINQFPMGDWAFENDTIALINNTVWNFHGLCYGDVNGSYIPPAKKSPTISLAQKNEMSVPVAERIEIPIMVDASLSVAAVSIILNYDQDIAEIIDVNIPGIDNDNLLYNSKDGTLAISWYRLNPVLIDEHGILLNIGLRILNADENFSLEIQPLSELGDQYAEVIENVNLYYPKLKITSEDGVCFGQNYPNPFSENSEIEIRLPETGKLKINLFNSCGKYLYSILDNDIESGVHKITFESGDLPEGVYYYRMTFIGENVQSSKTKRMIIIH